LDLYYHKSVFIFSLRALRAEILRRKVRSGNFYFKKRSCCHRHYRLISCTITISVERSASDQV